MVLEIYEKTDDLMPISTLFEEIFVDTSLGSNQLFRKI
jgi:hypothetical protein